MLRFTPAEAGSTLAVVSGARALVVRTPDDAGAVDALWVALSTGDNVQAVLEVLAAKGVFSTPPFALFQATAGVPDAGYTITCIVRGDIPIELTTLAGPETVDASGVTTWVERSIPGVLAFTAGTASGAGSLPIVGAAVWASSISWSAAGVTAPPPAASTVTPAAPLPTSQPLPPPVAAVPVAVVPAPAVPVTALTVPVSPLPEPIAEHTIAAHTVTSGDIAAEANDAASAADVAAGEAGAYDNLFEETMMRSIEDAAVRPPSDDDEHHGDAPAAAAAADDRDGDHDGMTVMSGDIAKLRAGRKSRKAPEPTTSDAPVAYTLALSTGGVESLDGIALVGRSPSVSKVSGGLVPKLIAIPGDQDISRNHVQFAVEGGTVVVTDLHSRNGTTISLPGKPPQLLRQGESTSVLVDTVVDLGGGVTITVGHAAQGGAQ